MKSRVIEGICIEDIYLPADLLAIEIPSWEAVDLPLINYAKAQYMAITGQEIDKLEDWHLESLPQIPADSLMELSHYGRQVYKTSQTQYQYYQVILPYVLAYIHQHIIVQVDNQEQADYQAEYIERIQAYAYERDMDLEDYGRQVMGLDGDIYQTFMQRAQEDFSFKLLAHDLYPEADLDGSREGYEAFIMGWVLDKQADPIDIQDQVPYSSYVAMLPEIRLSDALYDYIVPRIEIVVNPQAEFEFRS